MFLAFTLSPRAAWNCSFLATRKPSDTLLLEPPWNLLKNDGPRTLLEVRINFTKKVFFHNSFRAAIEFKNCDLK